MYKSLEWWQLVLKMVLWVLCAGSVLGFATTTLVGLMVPQFVRGSTVGASAAIFGLFGALVYYGRRSGSSLIHGQAVSWAITGFVFGFVIPGVDNFAHAGGFVGGYLAGRLLDPLQPERIDHMGVGLVERTLGQLGIGNIGAEVFRLAKPFGMRFIAHDPYADPRLAQELGVRLVGLEELFREADVLSVSCPLNDETHHIVNAERLALMKPSAYLINTSRGPVVDEAALTEALQKWRIAGAGLDVFEQEPSPADNPLYGLDNVIVTPHALCWTDQCFAGIGAADVKAVLDVMHGRVPTGIVNREIVDRPAWRAKLERYAATFGG